MPDLRTLLERIRAEKEAENAEKAEEKESETETATTTAAPEETEAPETEASTETEAPAESEAPAETDASSTAEATSDKIYTFTADETKFEVAEDAFGNTTITYKADDIELAADTCMILINADEDKTLPDYTLEELGPIFKDSMGLGDAFSVTDEKVTTFNGYEAYEFDGVYTVGGLGFDLKVIVAREDTKLLVVCPMTYSEVTEAVFPEIQKVMDTVKIV